MASNWRLPEVVMMEANRTEAGGTEARQVFLGAFDQRREVFIARLKTCRDDFSEAAVHDVRVASRRAFRSSSCSWVSNRSRRARIVGSSRA